MKRAVAENVADSTVAAPKPPNTSVIYEQTKNVCRETYFASLFFHSSYRASFVFFFHLFFSFLRAVCQSCRHPQLWMASFIVRAASTSEASFAAEFHSNAVIPRIPERTTEDVWLPCSPPLIRLHEACLSTPMPHPPSCLTFQTVQFQICIPMPDLNPSSSSSSSSVFSFVFFLPQYPLQNEVWIFKFFY